MATFKIDPPAAFKCSNPDGWEKWSTRWARFRSGSGLSEKDEEVQINTLIYCMGEDAESVFGRLTLSDENRKKYDEVIKAFSTHFQRKKNVVFERALFNRRIQKEDETVEEFINSAIELAKHCKYGTLKDELIRDRIVVGIKDSDLSEILQMDPDLTLQIAMDKARLSESVKNQQTIVRQAPTTENTVPTPSVDVVGGARPKRYGKPMGNKQQVNTKPGSNCYRCGKAANHSRSQCPARDANCGKCGLRGHFAAVCRSSVHEVTRKC